VVDKMNSVLNNEKLAQEILETMYEEFTLLKMLDHPNVLKSKYFARRPG